MMADFRAPSLLCLWKSTFAQGQKGGKTMKWGQVSRVNSRTALMAGIAATMMWAAPAAAQERQSYTIPSGDAAQTVQRLAVQSGVQVMVPDADLAGIKTNAVNGSYTPVEALRLIDRKRTRLNSSH